MFFTLPANLYPENSFNSCSIVTYDGAVLGAIAGSESIILPKNKCVLLCNDLATTLTLKLTYFQSDELTADVVDPPLVILEIAPPVIVTLFEF